MDRQPDPQVIASVDRNGVQGGIITEPLAALKPHAAQNKIHVMQCNVIPGYRSYRRAM
jgi:hypothetical protein